MKIFRKEFSLLFWKEMILEFRNLAGIQSIFLYTLSTLFLCYWAVHKLEGPEWVALFWIILVFSAINAVGRSFLQESSGIQLYYFGVAGPASLLLAKMVFNALVLLSLSAVLLFLFCITLGFPIHQTGPFLLCVLLGVLGISSAFTFLSGLSSKASNNLTLFSVLGIPVLLPLIFVVIHFSVNTLSSSLGDFGKDIMALILLNLLIPSIATLVFPYIWRN